MTTEPSEAATLAANTIDSLVGSYRTQAGIVHGRWVEGQDIKAITDIIQRAIDAECAKVRAECDDRVDRAYDSGVAVGEARADAQ